MGSAAVTSSPSDVLIGTAGWSIPEAVRDRFPEGDSLLARYAVVFPAVEINTSFYRPHQPSTYLRWAASTPAEFRFCVKIPKAISHERRLVGCDQRLQRFLFEVSHLGERLGCLLLQLPGSLAYQPQMLEFFESLRRLYAGMVALEPRHASWREPATRSLFDALGISLVHPDPDPLELAHVACRFPSYLRLHGSPRMYDSPYSNEAIACYAEEMRRPGGARWCIFDNTRLGQATSNALLLALLR
jgi:uncharacterized protein YecE (DUF72 family)